MRHGFGEATRLNNSKHATYSRVSYRCKKWIRLATKDTNPGLFQISFQKFWRGAPNVLKSDLKVQNLSYLGPIWPILGTNLKYPWHTKRTPRPGLKLNSWNSCIALKNKEKLSYIWINSNLIQINLFQVERIDSEHTFVCSR